LFEKVSALDRQIFEYFCAWIRRTKCSKKCVGRAQILSDAQLSLKTKQGFHSNQLFFEQLVRLVNPRPT
jgi:hypothetical protein